MRYKILNGQAVLHCNLLSCQFSLVQEDTSINCINNNQMLMFISTFSVIKFDIWNALPASVVEASSLDSFKRLLDQDNLTQFSVLQ